jgi:hypothetical protein
MKQNATGATAKMLDKKTSNESVIRTNLDFITRFRANTFLHNKSQRDNFVRGSPSECSLFRHRRRSDLNARFTSSGVRKTFESRLSDMTNVFSSSLLREAVRAGF